MEGRRSYEHLYKRAIKTAKAKGLGDEAEDFAGWICLKWLEGKAQHQTLNQSITDYLREFHGSLGGRGKRDGILRAYRAKTPDISGCDEQSAEENLERMWHGSSHAQGINPAIEEYHRRHIDPRGFLSPRLAEIWSLYSRDVALKKIAEMMQVTESRASQLLSKAKLEVLRFEGLRLMQERTEEDRLVFEIDWISL